MFKPLTNNKHPLLTTGGVLNNFVHLDLHRAIIRSATADKYQRKRFRPLMLPAAFAITTAIGFSNKVSYV